MSQPTADPAPKQVLFEPPVKMDPFSYYPRLRRVRRYVEEHIAEKINLRDVASVAALDEKYFSKYFHSKAQVRFSEWLAQRRVVRAVELLEREHIPIGVAAHQAGFSSDRTFRRVFKRIVGMTPVAYRSTIQRRVGSTVDHDSRPINHDP